jgi:glycosyltransferase involved in cell wall biosynthesis
LIPCYNAGPWIAECIQSALDQTYPNKEVVVVDDGSTDNSLEVIRGFGERIRLETGPNRGGNVARNRLVKLSQGEWLEFLDADDFILPQKIEKQLTLLEACPRLDVVYSPTRLFYPENGEEVVSAVEDEDVFANYFRWAHFSTTSLLLRKEAVESVGGWKEDQPVCQEHELILRLLLSGKEFAIMPEALGINRMQYTNSVSRRSPMKVLHHKMALTERLESYLADRGELNDVRQFALAEARYHGARAAYPWDPAFAHELARKAAAKVSITLCRGLNTNYKWAFRLFGLGFAERLAKFRRDLFGAPRS